MVKFNSGYGALLCVNCCVIIATSDRIMKTFKDLQVGDKIYIGFYAEFVQYIEYVEGYLHIYYFSERKKPKYAYSNALFIPLNHINANNVKVGGRYIFISKSRYKKYIMDFMNSQLEK